MVAGIESFTIIGGSCGDMKTIFTDVDGVINTRNTKAISPSGYRGISDKLVKKLKAIVDDTGAKVVLSSDWRLLDHYDNKDFHYLKQKLYYKGGIKIFDYTPDIHWEKRGQEIRRWLAEHPVDNFVVLDDIDFPDFYFEDFMDHVIIVNERTGLTDENVKQAIAILNGENK